MRRTSAAVWTTLLIGSVLAGCGDDPVRAEPGEVIDHGRRLTSGTESLVAVPVGTISVRATPLLDDLDAVWGTTGTPPSAPEGGGFVGLDLSLDDKGAILELSRPPGDAQATSVTLVAGDVRYPVDSPYDVVPARGLGASHDPASARPNPTGPIYVAVAAQTEDLSVEIEYDGVVQSIDVPSGRITSGDAEGLYEATAVRGPLPQDSCGSAEPTGQLPRAEFRGVTCTITEAALVPYTAELGWAPPGRRWAIVSARTVLAGPLGWSTPAGDLATNYRTTTFTSEVRLNGTLPDATIATDPAIAPRDDTASDQRRTYTWQVGAAGPMLLTVRDAFVGTQPVYPDRGAPKNVRVAAEKTVSLRF